MCSSPALQERKEREGRRGTYTRIHTHKRRREKVERRGRNEREGEGLTHAYTPQKEERKWRGEEGSTVGLLSDHLFDRDISRALFWWTLVLGSLTAPLYVCVVWVWRVSASGEVPLVGLAADQAEHLH